MLGRKVADTMKNQTYVCRKLFLYYFLTEKGFKPYRTVPDKWDCNKTIWFYDDSNEIRNAVEEYYSTKR